MEINNLKANFYESKLKWFLFVDPSMFTQRADNPPHSLFIFPSSSSKTDEFCHFSFPLSEIVFLIVSFTLLRFRDSKTPLEFVLRSSSCPWWCRGCSTRLVFALLCWIRVSSEIFKSLLESVVLPSISLKRNFTTASAVHELPSKTFDSYSNQSAVVHLQSWKLDRILLHKQLYCRLDIDQSFL